MVVSLEGGNSAKLYNLNASDMIRMVVSLEGGNTVKIYSLSASEIWHDKNGSLS
jgi:hypothetical protein